MSNPTSPTRAYLLVKEEIARMAASTKARDLSGESARAKLASVLKLAIANDFIAPYRGTAGPPVFSRLHIPIDGTFADISFVARQMGEFQIEISFDRRGPSGFIVISNFKSAVDESPIVAGHNFKTASRVHDILDFLLEEAPADGDPREGNGTHPRMVWMMEKERIEAPRRKEHLKAVRSRIHEDAVRLMKIALDAGLPERSRPFSERMDVTIEFQVDGSDAGVRFMTLLGLYEIDLWMEREGQERALVRVCFEDNKLDSPRVFGPTFEDSEAICKVLDYLL